MAKLNGIDDAMRAVTELAIEYTKIDFGVTCGLRTVEEQRALVDAGASQTMNSLHITGQAVDVVAYVGPRISWEVNLYDDIAEAFKIAGKNLVQVFVGVQPGRFQILEIGMVQWKRL